MTTLHRKHAIETARSLRDDPYRYLGFAEVVKGNLRGYTKGWRVAYKEPRATVYERPDEPDWALCLGESDGIRRILRIDYGEI